MPVFNPQDPTKITMKGTAGGPTNDTIRIYTKIFPLTGTAVGGYSLDISEAGFTMITSVQMSPINNTNSLLGVPIIAEKSRSTSAIVVNILTINSQSLLGLVQVGTGLIFAANLAGMSIDLRVEGV